MKILLGKYTSSHTATDGEPHSNVLSANLVDKIALGCLYRPISKIVCQFGYQLKKIAQYLKDLPLWCERRRPFRPQSWERRKRLLFFCANAERGLAKNLWLEAGAKQEARTHVHYKKVQAAREVMSIEGKTWTPSSKENFHASQRSLTRLAL